MTTASAGGFSSTTLVAHTIGGFEGDQAEKDQASRHQASLVDLSDDEVRGETKRKQGQGLLDLFKIKIADLISPHERH